MAQGNYPLYSLNGGEVSRLALTRLDLSRLTISAERVENFLISTLGWIGLRPGTADLGGTKDNQKTQLLRFVGTTSTCSLLELTANTLRVRNDGSLVTRNAVSSTIANGSFTGGTTTGWTISVASGGVVAGVGPYATIKGTGLDRSFLRQTVTIPAGSSGVEHGLRIVVPKGPVQLRVGTASGLDDIVNVTDLATGTHSLAVILSGSVFIEFSAPDIAPRQVGPISFEAAGTLELSTPWGASDIGFVRYDQQGDVIFAANRSYRQKRIESRSRRSWSVVDYIPIKGPFLATPDTPSSITPSAQRGNITLTASRPTFNAKHVGALWELTHPGQNPTATLTGADQYTGYIRVVGVSNVRIFHFTVSGTWSGTITLQQGIGAPEGWVDRKNYTGNIDMDFNDGYDNSVIYYRIGFKPGNYTSGTANVSLSYSGGTTIGVATITGFTSPTVVSADVISALGDNTATSTWREGSWSDYRGWPRSEKFQDGRLIWLGKNFLYGSVSDDYANYDDTINGDSAPVIRSIATGPADGNIWILRLYRLFVASATAITGIRSSSLDEPITATAFTARDIDELGAADIAPVSVAGRGIYVGRSGIDLFEIVGDGGVGDYTVNSLTRMNPEIAEIGIVMIAAQRRPEPRIWCVLADGTMALVTYNRDENVVAWQRWTTQGFVENVEVLPNLIQDDVYVVVQRVFGGSMIRRVELCSYENDTRGGATHRVADSGRLVTSVTPTTTFTVPDFAGLPVVVWTAEKKAYAVTANGSGVIVLPAATTSAWVGLGYTGKFQSTKLAYASQTGTALNQKKRVDHLSLNFDTTVRAGVRFGPSFDRLDPLPLVVKGLEVDPTLVEQDIDDVAIPFNGSWDTDSRFCIEAKAPYPCRVKAAVVSITTHDAR